MPNKSIARISIGCNEPKYIRDCCEFQVEKYVYGLKPADKVSFETSDYIYNMSMKTTREISNGYCKVIISMPVKPSKDIHLKITING
jgi:hypothetical protein